MLRLLSRSFSAAAQKLLLLVPLIWTNGVWALDCPLVDYYLKAQAEINTFPATCDKILGFLFVRNFGTVDI